MANYLKITLKELQALIEIADTCDAIGDGLAYEAKIAVKAYKAVLKRNGLTANLRKEPTIKIGNSYSE
jgi:hypothetical protein